MNDDQLLRYSRQIMLPEFDVAGQDALLDAHALIVGLGGLGSPAALYLAAAGIGSLTLVDHDTVEVSNLQRQIIHDQHSLGRDKVASAADRIAAINPDTQVRTVAANLDEPRLREIIADVDVVIDGTDNFAIRYAINKACFAQRRPLVSGAAIRMEGQVAVFDPRRADSPCYQCLYADAADVVLNCAENGVAAPLVGIVGSIQAMEAIKVVARVGDTLTGYVLYLDAKRMELRKLKLSRDPNCPTCAER
ncbi:MAG: molybdopterin-synthase adenylyltransferase MoeB [Gammaproteobacteria bacterium]|nr:molybdopterin-synthase adenylyltransferase MoeB [Gammaproteobacteria bacterium]